MIPQSWLEAATKGCGWTELAASPVRNELIPQNELSVVPPDLDGNSVCAACRALISWNPCLPAAAKIHCPVLAAGVACAVTMARRHLQLALPCRTDAKPVTLCSCLISLLREILISPFHSGCKCFVFRDKCYMEPRRPNTSTVAIKQVMPLSATYCCHRKAFRG